MATDQGIEIFSVDLFRSLWHVLGFTKTIMPRHTNYNAPNNLACSSAVVEAVLFRKDYFKYSLRHKLFEEYEVFSASSIDFYIYLEDNMNVFIAFNELTVFDKLFMTCAVVAEMVHVCWVKMNKMHLNNASLCWAMYFDITSKEEFYDKGGWEGLEQSAENINKVLTEHYAKLYLGQYEGYRYENDFLNVKVCFEQLSSHYSIPKLIAVLKPKMQSYKLSCLDCRCMFHALNIVFVENDNDWSEYQYCECYLQIMQHMLPPEELNKTCAEILRDPEMKEIGKALDVVSKPTKGATCKLLENKSEFYEQHEIYEKRYKALNNLKFLNALLVPDSELNDNQCIFCSADLINLEDNLKVVDHQVERIKSVICQTLIDVHLNEDKSVKGLSKAGKNENSNRKNDGTNDALKMFFALGVESAIPRVLANLEKDKQNKVDLTDSCAEKHSEKVPDDEKKKASGKKKKSKKKKNVK